MFFSIRSEEEEELVCDVFVRLVLWDPSHVRIVAERGEDIVSRTRQCRQSYFASHAQRRGEYSLAPVDFNLDSFLDCLAIGHIVLRNLGIRVVVVVGIFKFFFNSRFCVRTCVKAGRNQTCLISICCVLCCRD